jgi:hypothetical protein
MYHVISENPFTIDVFPLSKYAKTFFRAYKKAQEKNQIFLVESDSRPMKEISFMDLTAFDVIIQRQGSFTTAVVRWMEQVITVGVAKRMVSTDKENPAKGEHIAVRRGIQNLFADDFRELASSDVDSFVGVAEGRDVSEGEPFEVEREQSIGSKWSNYGDSVTPDRAPLISPMLEDLQAHEEAEAELDSMREALAEMPAIMVATDALGEITTCPPMATDGVELDEEKPIKAIG